MSQTQATAGGHVDEMISAAVRGVIAQRRLSPTQVAAAIGISRGAFYQKLNNASPWQAREVDQLARFLDVPRDSLYEGRAEFTSSPAASLSARTRSSTDRASDYGSQVRHFRPAQPRRRRSDRRRQLSVVPLRLVVDTGADRVPA